MWSWSCCVFQQRRPTGWFTGRNPVKHTAVHNPVESVIRVTLLGLFDTFVCGCEGSHYSSHVAHITEAAVLFFIWAGSEKPDCCYALCEALCNNSKFDLQKTYKNVWSIILSTFCEMISCLLKKELSAMFIQCRIILNIKLLFWLFRFNKHQHEQGK